MILPCERCHSGQMIGQRFTEFDRRGTRYTCLLCAHEIEELETIPLDVLTAADLAKPVRGRPRKNT